MKEFWKMLLAAVLGCIIAGIFTFVLFITFIGSLFSFEAEGPVLRANSVLKIDMSAFIFAEKKQAADIQSYLTGDAVPSVTLWNALKAIKKQKATRISIVYSSRPMASLPISPR